MDLETAPRKELIALIETQQQRITQLEERIKQLERKLPPDLPFHPKPSIKLKKNQPRKQRDRGFARKSDTPTHITKHAYSACPDCGGKLYQGWMKTSRQVIDIPLVPAAITEHQVFEHWCSHCHKKVSPRVDLSHQVLGNHRVSLRLMSYIATLRETHRQPVDQIQDHLRTFYQLDLSLGEITEICHTVAQQQLPVYDNLETAIRSSPVVHGDETGWREDGINGYIWNFNTPQIQYLTYRKTRGQVVVKEVIGDEFEGVLVSDFYGSYNIHLGYHQRCWVHLLRDIDKLVEQYPQHKTLKHWAKCVKTFYHEAKAYPGPDPYRYPDPRAQKQQRFRDQARFRDQLLKLCLPYLSEDVPMKTLCQRIDKFQDELFVFISHSGVPSSNNSAERALRHSVISRKISGGTRSAKGSQTKFTLASVFGTWKLQHKNPFQECLKLLTAASTGQPLPAIVPRV